MLPTPHTPCPEQCRGHAPRAAHTSEATASAATQIRMPEMPCDRGCLGRGSAQLRCMQRFCCVLLKRHPYTAASRGSQSLQDMTPAYSVRNVDRSVELLVCPLCSGLRGTPRPVPSHGLKSVLKPGCGECAGAACRPCCPPSPCAGGWRGQERRCAGQGGRRSSMRLRSQSCCP